MLHWLGLLLDNRAFVLTTPLEKEARLSQSQLAEETGIPVKTIQQYEQRRKDINKAQAEYVIKLSQVLCCKPQELMEINEIVSTNF